MKTKRLLFIASAIYLLFGIQEALSQSTFPILKMEIISTPVANDTSGGLPDISDSTVFNLTMHVELFDTSDIDKVYAYLGDNTPGNRLQHIFDWDVSGSTGGGTSYSRAGNELMLGLGNFNNLLNYVAGVRIKRSDGSFTDLISFSR